MKGIFPFSMIYAIRITFNGLEVRKIGKRTLKLPWNDNCENMDPVGINSSSISPKWLTDMFAFVFLYSTNYVKRFIALLERNIHIIKSNFEIKKNYAS